MHLLTLLFLNLKIANKIKYINNKSNLLLEAVQFNVALLINLAELELVSKNIHTQKKKNPSKNINKTWYQDAIISL